MSDLSEAEEKGGQNYITSAKEPERPSNSPIDTVSTPAPNNQTPNTE
jgi:hypothetical protein